MDQKALVEIGHTLVREMESSHLVPRLVMWVHNADTGVWKLWICPSKELKDKREFYRRLSFVLSKNRDKLSNIDVGDVNFVSDTHGLVKAIRIICKVTDFSTVHLVNTKLDNFYLPEAIVLKSDF